MSLPRVLVQNFKLCSRSQVSIFAHANSVFGSGAASLNGARLRLIRRCFSSAVERQSIARRDSIGNYERKARTASAETKYLWLRNLDVRSPTPPKLAPFY